MTGNSIYYPGTLPTSFHIWMDSLCTSWWRQICVWPKHREKKKVHVHNFKYGYAMDIVFQRKAAWNIWCCGAFLLSFVKKWMHSIYFTWHNIKHMKIIYFQTVCIYLATTSFICETVTPSHVLSIGNCKYKYHSEAVVLKCCLQRNWILRKKKWVCENWEWGDAARSLKRFKIQIQAPYMTL